jgi:ribosomal protein L37E
MKKIYKILDPQILKAEPNYEIECEVCGKKPTVDLYWKTSKILLNRTKMCGVCTFGEADAIDPENW